MKIDNSNECSSPGFRRVGNFKGSTGFTGSTVEVVSSRGRERLGVSYLASRV